MPRQTRVFVAAAQLAAPLFAPQWPFEQMGWPIAPEAFLSVVSPSPGEHIDGVKLNLLFVLAAMQRVEIRYTIDAEDDGLTVNHELLHSVLQRRFRRSTGSIRAFRGKAFSRRRGLIRRTRITHQPPPSRLRLRRKTR